jgi:hypothetical protein
MKASRIGLSLLSAVAFLAIPSVAPAAYLVPPENSAATQYTEAYPTAGGNRNVPGEGKRGKSSPKQVLGGRNARKLEAQGPEGEAAAEVAAETAPVGGAATPPPSAGERAMPAGGGDSAAAQPAPQRQAPPAQPADGGSGDRSSAVGEVLGRTTGSSSSGGTDLLLPLAIGAAIAWAMAYLWRQRKRQTA